MPTIRRVLVLGATGLIGEAILRGLDGRGYGLVALARGPSAMTRAAPHVTWRFGDLNRLVTEDAWAPYLEGVDAVVNAAGVLDDALGDDARRIVVDAAAALAEACAARAISCLVHISSVGADAASPEPFLRLKGEAEAAIRALSVPSVVLRPGLVVAPVAYGGTALLRALAAMPLAVPLVDPDALVQTIGSDEVAEAVAEALAGTIPAGGVYDVVEDEAHRLADIVLGLRARLGLAAAPVVPVPKIVARATGIVADALGALGWRSPLRSAAQRLAAAGVRGDPAPLAAVRGRGFRPFARTLGALPATPQERWFARLYLLKPVLVALFALFWIASGAIALAQIGAATAVLTGRGIGYGLALAIVAGGAVLDIAIGVAGLFAATLARAAIASVLLSLGYLAGGVVLAPDLVIDPLGPLVKILPVVALGLVLAAIARAR